VYIFIGGYVITKTAIVIVRAVFDEIYCPTNYNTERAVATGER